MPGMDRKDISVPKDKRTEGELAINTDARRICTYVLRITGNDKKFPKEQEWFTNLLREKAIGIDLNCWKANNIYVNSQTLYDKRMALEAEAGDACTEILEIINIGRSLYHMSTKRYKYLTDQYVELRKKIRNWYKSDRERLKP